ncbi:MAG: peroxiredoxin [bacterium]
MEEEQQKQGMPLIGDKFPELEVKTTEGTINLPEKYEGQWFVLFSHPADFTPVCTTEFVSFQKKYEQFLELDTELIGLSIDGVHSHLKWAEWIEDNVGEKIEFPIIADAGGAVARELGLMHTASSSSTVRAVFIVDPKSTIRAILYYPAELGRNMDEILRMIKGFKTHSEEKVAIPANWPDNELIGDNLILPPASTTEEIQQRKEQAEKGEIEFMDWWLCHREQ